jgi:hypothetical protein
MMAKVTGNVDLFAELFPWTPDDMADPFLTSNPVPVPAAAMETELIPCTRLQVLLGERAYENLRRYYGFEEAELTKRGQKMWRNGEWEFAAFCLSIRNMIAWLGDGILVDGTRRGLTDGAYFLKILMALISLCIFGHIPMTTSWKSGLLPRRH